MSVAAALEKGNYRHLDLLVRAGFNVDTATERGQTPLILCCYIEDESRGQHCAHLLLSRGANVGLADPSGRNALMHACLTGRRRLVELYIQPECVDFDLNAKDKDGNTALHHAVLSGNPDIVRSMTRALGKFHLGTSEPNTLGLTPYGLGRKLGFQECCHVLSEGRRSTPPTHLNMHNLRLPTPTAHEVDVVTRDRHIPTEMSHRSLQPLSAMSVATRVHLSTPGEPASRAVLREEEDLQKTRGRLTSWKMLEQLHPIRSVVLSKSYRKPAVPPPPPSPMSERGRVKRKPSRRSTTSSQSSRKSGSGSPFWRTARESPRGGKKGSRSPSRTAVASPLLSPKNSFGGSRSQSPTRGNSSAKAGANRAPIRTEESGKTNQPKLSSPQQSLLTKADVSPETGSTDKNPAGDKSVVTRSGAFELIRTSSVSKGDKVATIFDTMTEPTPTH
ncbi:uncharacterized protein LOC118432231 [Branchiostoma floridae]|uniref:Uncharacterized protein LOC118432231 n=1 Tax=Branchiostoma floridae TaxID=7739 RepID=A0A9J7MFB8_BRAFL|nr:uncharacterized protein LOC118432231 [Branchiostoma floridae]